MAFSVEDGAATGSTTRGDPLKSIREVAAQYPSPLLPWFRRLFGVPPSLESRDSTGTTPHIMRLIVTDTGQFVEINDPAKHIYAILSHTWDPEGEQSFREVREIRRALGIPLILPESALDEEFFTRIIPRRTTQARWGKNVQRSLAHVVKALSRRAPPSVTPAAASSTTATLSSSVHRNALDIDLSSQVSTRPTILNHTRLSRKIKGACAVARAYGYRLLWIDSCCIEKESSAELSEAINSMFSWYRCASVCFTLISDFPLDLVDTSYDDAREVVESLRANCRWFKRGWTLQELIAPREVVFLGKDWRFVGNKSELAYLLAAVTGIEAEILTHQKHLDEVSVADRMCWVAHRQTTRTEDRAYSLFGIFGINLPIIYGEGDHAFLRLQKEILQTIPDQSLFVWNHDYLQRLNDFPWPPLVASVTASDESGLLADSPTLFEANASRKLAEDVLRMDCPFIRLGPHRVVSTICAVPPRLLAGRLGIPELHPSYAITPHGVHTDLPLIRIADIASVVWERGESEEAYLAVLACEATKCPDSLVAMVCTMQDHIWETGDGSARKSLSKSLLGWDGGNDTHTHPHPFVILPPELVKQVRNAPELLRMRQVTIPLTSASSSELPKLSQIPGFGSPPPSGTTTTEQTCSGGFGI